MTGMDMGAFDNAYKRSLENSGANFGDVEKLVIRDGLIVRLVGTMGSAWEHFAETAKGKRPFYCGGPASDCQLCDIASRYSMSEDATLQQKGNDMKVKERYYFNVLDRSPEGKAAHAKSKHTMLLTQNDKGLNVGSMVLQAIGSVIQMRKQTGQPADPNGYDLQLSKSGVKLTTKYGANFTGGTDPLTVEEAAYDLYDLNTVAALSTASDIAAAASYLESGPGERSEAAAGGGFSTSGSAGGGDPAQVARAAMAAQPASAPVEHIDPGPAPAAAPAAAAPAPAPAAAPAPAPAAAPAAAAPAPAPVVVDYADTTPQVDHDPATCYQVPCGACGSVMQISLVDKRDLQCHNKECNKVYQHPQR